MEPSKKEPLVTTKIAYLGTSESHDFLSGLHRVLVSEAHIYTLSLMNLLSNAGFLKPAITVSLLRKKDTVSCLMLRQSLTGKTRWPVFIA